jgi:hypothetical protein
MLSFAIMQPLERMAQQIAGLPQRAGARGAADRRRHQQGRRLHARALRRHDGSGRGERDLEERRRGGTSTSRSSRSTGSSCTSPRRSRMPPFR